MIADLPHVAQLNSLPLRSQVAFAARCARRVRHLFKLEGQSDPAAESQVKRAVQLAESFVAGRSLLVVENVVSEDSHLHRTCGRT